MNARNQTLGWHPVFYFYRSFPVEMLSALYQMADVCLVTPKRDGMNLVSKEYVASRIDEHGVLILSEMAGASKELSEAIDRKSVVWGKSVSVRVDLGGRSIIKQKKKGDTQD